MNSPNNRNDSKSWLVEKDRRYPIHLPSPDILRSEDTFVVVGDYLHKEDWEVFGKIGNQFKLVLCNGQIAIRDSAFSNNQTLTHFETACPKIEQWAFWSVENLLYLSLTDLKQLGGAEALRSGISSIAACPKLHVIRFPLEPPVFYSQKMFTYFPDKIFLVVPDVSKYEAIIKEDKLGLDDVEIVQLPPDGEIEVEEIIPNIIEIKIGNIVHGESYPSRKWVNFS